MCCFAACLPAPSLAEYFRPRWKHVFKTGQPTNQHWLYVCMWRRNPLRKKTEWGREGLKEKRRKERQHFWNNILGSKKQHSEKRVAIPTYVASSSCCSPEQRLYTIYHTHAATRPCRMAKNRRARKKEKEIEMSECNLNSLLRQKRVCQIWNFTSSQLASQLAAAAAAAAAAERSFSSFLSLFQLDILGIYLSSLHQSFEERNKSKKAPKH